MTDNTKFNIMWWGLIGVLILVLAYAFIGCEDIRENFTEDTRVEIKEVKIPVEMVYYKEGIKKSFKGEIDNLFIQEEGYNVFLMLDSNMTLNVAQIVYLKAGK